MDTVDGPSRLSWYKYYMATVYIPEIVIDTFETRSELFFDVTQLLGENKLARVLGQALKLNRGHYAPGM